MQMKPSPHLNTYPFSDYELSDNSERVTTPLKSVMLKVEITGKEQVLDGAEMKKPGTSNFDLSKGMTEVFDILTFQYK